MIRTEKFFTKILIILIRYIINKKLIQYQKSGVLKDPKKAYQRAEIELVAYKD